MEKPNIKTVAGVLGILKPTAKKYIFMTKEDISALDNPTNYKKRESSMNAWLHVICKMMADDCSNETIYFYIKHREDYKDSNDKLAKYIYLIGKTFRFQHYYKTSWYQIDAS